ncbi:MAG: 16S rRNA (uracil(1498)-N(3))-methyltransferase [Betaproteobacteria bacterium TMED82]|nr:MAG: 16S rRNA (uracil(1498)-N(3))-methyltransferase [Betaproteobacteria bacterium TMED82]
MTPRLYFPKLSNETIILDYKQTHYVKTVLRIKVGQKIILFNGNGLEAEAKIASFGDKNTTLHPHDFKNISRDPPIEITVAQCLCLSNKMDYVVQKSTELGAANILPINSQRNQLNLSINLQKKKIQRWQLIADASSQQCGRTNRTIVQAPMDIESFFSEEKKKNKKTLRWVLDPDATLSVSNVGLKNANKLLILIGPEAGFSDEEDLLANESCFTAIKFGKRILRTETVAPAILAVVNYKLGEF